MNYLDGGMWIRGAALAAWLELRHIDCDPQWRNGQWVSVWSADRFLTPLEIHLADLPDDLWGPGPVRTHRLTDADRRQIAHDFGANVPMPTLTETYLVSPSTVHKIARAEGVTRPKFTLEEKLAANIRQRGDDDCWPWTGKTDNFGYPVQRHAGKVIRVRRYLVSRRDGITLSRGQHVLDTCDNASCCNEAHLEAKNAGRAIRRALGR